MNLLQFIQSLGLAEYLITIALILMIIYGIYDSRKVDKMYDDDQERFNENYNR